MIRTMRDDISDVKSTMDENAKYKNLGKTPITVTQDT